LSCLRSLDRYYLWSFFSHQIDAFVGPNLTIFEKNSKNHSSSMDNSPVQPTSSSTIDSNIIWSILVICGTFLLGFAICCLFVFCMMRANRGQGENTVYLKTCNFSAATRVLSIIGHVMWFSTKIGTEMSTRRTRTCIQTAKIRHAPLLRITNGSLAPKPQLRSLKQMARHFRSVVLQSAPQFLGPMTTMAATRLQTRRKK
jgi:hypothetical protein